MSEEVAENVVEEAPQQTPTKDKQLNTGWFCITKDLVFMQESDGITEYNPNGGRPIEKGNNNELLVVGVMGNSHKAAVDLTNGVIAIDFDRIDIQNGTIELDNFRLMFTICEETNIIGEMKHRKTTKPNKKGDYFITYDPVIFRPIWFVRNISTLPGPVYCIGAQATTPSEMGRRNVKKLVSFFPDGRIGIS